MRYLFTTKPCVMSEALKPGEVALIFSPAGQGLAYTVVSHIAKALDNADLYEIATMLRTEHDKGEEN